MPKKHEPLLLVTLNPSKRLNRLLAVIHTVAIGASIANTLPIAVKLALLIGIGIQFWCLNRRMKNEQCSLKQSEVSDWEISGKHDFEPIQILNSTVITTVAIFLHFDRDAHKQSLLIANDALSADDYRRLILRLKTTAKK